MILADVVFHLKTPYCNNKHNSEIKVTHFTIIYIYVCVYVYCIYMYLYQLTFAIFNQTAKDRRSDTTLVWHFWANGFGSSPCSIQHNWTVWRGVKDTQNYEYSRTSPETSELASHETYEKQGKVRTTPYFLEVVLQNSSDPGSNYIDCWSY